MKHIYAAETVDELLSYQSFVTEILPKLNEFIDYIQKQYQVVNSPQAIIWTSADTATEILSDIPIPAYTDDNRTVITPDVEAWRQIYLEQLNGMEVENDNVRKVWTYYSTALSNRNILQILGHELVHHSELFLSDFDCENESGIWFEEGMAEYISRKFFLTNDEFNLETQVNQILVDLLRSRCGNHSLEDFGAETYLGDYGSIFFEYWRSFLAVKQIVDAHGGDVLAVLNSYHRWYNTNRIQPLTAWFGVSV